jgi:hypothetical protein
VGDREVVQARRALFVAAALSTLTTAVRATPPPKPECSRDTEPTKEEREIARQLYQLAKDLIQAGRHEEALENSTRAFHTLPNPILAMQIATIHRALRHSQEALIWYQAALDCGLDENLKPKLEADVEAVKAESGRIEVQFQPADPGGQTHANGAEIDSAGTTFVGEVLLDGRAVDVSEPIYLAPGEHQLVATNPEGLRSAVTFEISAGESKIIEIDLPPPLAPHVCLQPLPCLQPPPPEERLLNPRRFNLDLGGLVALDMDRDEFQNTGFGGQLAFAFSFPLGGSGLRSAIGIEGSPTNLRSGFFMPAGVHLEALAPFARRLTTGLGVAGGHAFADGNRSDDETWRPVSGPWIEAYAPFDMRIGSRVGIGIRPGILFSRQESVSDERFGLSFLRIGVFLRYSFSAACDRNHDSECRDEEPLAARRRSPKSM